jgi:hypothetical protein
MALQAPPRPSDEECERLQRLDRTAASNIRNSVDLSFPEFGKTEAAIDSAIADPRSNTELIGIALLPDEVEAMRDYGIYIDKATPIAFWSMVGRPDLFGGIWKDPPGSERHVLSIVDGRADTLRLARCLERDGVDVRYVWTRRSWAELTALTDRISHDWDALKADGIDIVSAGPDTLKNTVEVGVQGLTEAMASTLRDRYGDFIRVVEDSPGHADTAATPSVTP